MAVPKPQAGEGASWLLEAVVAGMGHPLGLPWARLCHFDAFDGLAIFLGCLLRVLSFISLGQGDLRVLVPRF